jgi:aminoglycoside phosphotransferase (APT) family kinase protein
MAVYLSSPGVPLDGLDRDGRMAGVVAAARWLVSLHGCEVACDRVLDLALEVENMALWGEMVAASHPRARAVVTRLVARLDRLSGTITAPVHVPIHKDFHYGHTLFDGGGLVVIDLDEVRWGDPAFDVAHYLANLSLLALRERMACAERDRLQSAFLGTYRSATGYQPDARHRFFHAYTCVKIAKQLARGRGPAPAPAGAERDHQVERILQKGLQCLPA